MLEFYLDFFFPKVNRTHDQDSDADLYRQSVLFGKRNTRYLCLSKIHGIADLVVESVSITGEKEPPPASYCLIAKTKDTGTSNLSNQSASNNLVLVW